MAKEVAGIIKLQCPAGQATPAPPVGPALGAHGANIAEFVKLHTVVAPVLNMEDPYTIAPDPPLVAKPDDGQAASTVEFD